MVSGKDSPLGVAFSESSGKMCWGLGFLWHPGDGKQEGNLPGADLAVPEVCTGLGVRRRLRPPQGTAETVAVVC